jgi:quercetin dioxygenase-like cupin family protein
MPGACDTRAMIRLALLSVFVLSTTWAQAATPVKVAPLLMKDLPDVAGKEVAMVTVEMAPGAVSPPHKHEANVFVYVLEGSIVMGVKGGKEITLGPGETFVEKPDDIHTVGRNASKTKPAKFLVFMVKTKGAPVSMPVAGHEGH